MSFTWGWPEDPRPAFGVEAKNRDALGYEYVLHACLAPRYRGPAWAEGRRVVSQYTAQFKEQFEACRSILSLADALYQRNGAKAVLDRNRYATLAVGSLYGKARKQMEAVSLLASEGYGEDAMILARSLVNLCIDLGYITADPDQTEPRARRWTAKGRVERREFSKRVGTTSPDEATADWSKEEAFADEWPKSIEQRAKDAGLESFYNLPYRHGSSFEHSDSWSATSFLDLKVDAVDMLTGPSDRYIDLALLTLACCAGEIASRFGKFYGFDFAGADVEMEALVKKAFPLKKNR